MVDWGDASLLPPSQFINTWGFKVYKRQIKKQELNGIPVVHVSIFDPMPAHPSAHAAAYRPLFWLKKPIDAKFSDALPCHRNSNRCVQRRLAFG